MWGKITSQVIVGVLILSTMGFTDLFADLTIGNFTAYVGSPVSIAADSGTPFPAAITVSDPSILGGEMDLTVNYNGGPGTTVASSSGRLRARVKQRLLACRALACLMAGLTSSMRL